MEVAKRRKKFGVPYPAMYATVVTVEGKQYSSTADGKPESANMFNAAQRAVQQPLETYNSVLMMCVLSGLKHPIISGACMLIWTVGNSIYARNYAQLGAAKRNEGFAVIKYIGLLGLLATSVSFTVSLMIKSASSS